MYAQVITSESTQLIAALSEEPGFRGADRTKSGARRILWESRSSAYRPPLDYGGRLLNLYRASGRPA